METKIGKRFKTYDQEQVLNVPINIGELIPKSHLSRVINEVVEKIDMAVLEDYYVGGGRSSYHPKMMIKIWIYGYCTGVYTTRRLSKALRENINFIWLSGNQQPCFKTLGSFRGDRMQGMIDLIFKEVLEMLIAMGYIELEDLYVDGSKWEANANRYKKVWRKDTARYKDRVLGRIEGLLEEIRVLQMEEDRHYGSGDLPETGSDESITIVMDSEAVMTHLARLQEQINQQGERAKALRSLGKKLEAEGEKLKKYEEQEEILGGRNSYSRTDPDATMLRMKDDRLLPAYNVQQTTSGQYIVNYTIAQNASDSPTLIPHLEKMKERFEVKKATTLTGDAGYGSEENYAELEERGIEAYVKYPSWYQENSGELAKKKFARENWPFDPIANTYTCPQNRILYFEREEMVVSDNGYQKKILIYQCENCDNCPFAQECKKSEDKARTVRHSPPGERFKAKARQLLNSEKGLEVRSNRSTEVESPFGDIKFNMKHARFVLRGNEKVYVEFGLLAVGHNLRKVYCQQSGIWAEYYVQRAAKKTKKRA